MKKISFEAKDGAKLTAIRRIKRVSAIIIVLILFAVNSAILADAPLNSDNLDSDLADADAPELGSIIGGQWRWVIIEDVTSEDITSENYVVSWESEMGVVDFHADGTYVNTSTSSDELVQSGVYRIEGNTIICVSPEIAQREVVTIIDNDRFIADNDITESRYYYERVESTESTQSIPEAENGITEDAESAEDDTLPQTGMLYLPVPILVGFGLLMIIIGLVSNHKRELNKLKPKMFASFFGVVAVFSSMGVASYNYLEDNRADIIAAQITQSLNEQIDRVELPEEIKVQEETGVKTPRLIEIDGEFYIGTLSIPSLNLTLPINNEWNEDKLKDSPCRYSGSIDSSMVICAHNYTSHFGKISNLKSGDKFVITDAENIEHWYTVDTITIVKDMDVDTMINSTYDLTLFTCTMDSKNRITVRCTRAN